MEKLLENDIQNYIYENLKEFSSLININHIKKEFKLDKYDILKSPLKYILNKNYKYFFKIFERWEDNYNDCVYKFPKEFNTAEWNTKTRSRIDLLVNYNDKKYSINKFLIFELKNDKQPERQTITELLQYSNWLQTQDFPWLENDNIWLIIIAKEWSNILVQSVVNWIIFKWLNIFPIKLKHNWTDENTIKLSFLDLYEFDFIKKLENNLINEEFYKTRLISFDTLFSDNELKVDYNNQKIISMIISKELDKKWYNWFIFFTEHDWNIKCWPIMYKNCIIIMLFNWTLLELKNRKNFSDKKKEILSKFNIDYSFDTSIIKSIVRDYFLYDNLSFKERNEWNTFDELSHNWRLFSYWASFWFLSTLHNDLIKYLIDDIDFRIDVLNTDDLRRDEMFNRMIINNIFNYRKNKVKELIEFYNSKVWQFVYLDDIDI